MLENSYAKLPKRFYEHISPEVFPNTEMILFNDELANELGLGFKNDHEKVQFCSGQKLFPGSKPIATAYAGSQFGHFVPQLGDGRAHLLGEINGLELQLKGSGRTRFSRRGDGRCTLGSAMREFLVSEGMHALGVPTTRSLCVVKTDEQLLRHEGYEPGAILTRVAESHLRVGTFQYFANQGDHEALEILLNYSIQRHYNEVKSKDLPERCIEFLTAFAKQQMELVANWYALGFIHGVMNTDNSSIAGITIDYGPCAFMDDFQWSKVFSSIDRNGRYAYDQQLAITQWNSFELAESLLPLFRQDITTARKLISETFNVVFRDFNLKIQMRFARKLGFSFLNEEIKTLIQMFLEYLESNSLDFTLSFTKLEALFDGDKRLYTENSQLNVFLEKWRDLDPDFSLCHSVNPKIIPRNHQIKNVIDEAYQNNFDPFQEMYSALKKPFNVPEKYLYLTDPPKTDERVHRTYCGT